MSLARHQTRRDPCNVEYNTSQEPVSFSLQFYQYGAYRLKADWKTRLYGALFSSQPANFQDEGCERTHPKPASRGLPLSGP